MYTPANQDRDHWTIEAMIYRGGSFVKALCAAAIHTDRDNLERLKAAWPEYWAEYEAIGKEMEIKDGKQNA